MLLVNCTECGKEFDYWDEYDSDRNTRHNRPVFCSQWCRLVHKRKEMYKILRRKG